MPAASPTTQQWTRRMRYTDQNLRVSDAERNAVAERLSAHYAEGRLDQAELDERISQTMSAKTRGDLVGLFDDLPDPEDRTGSAAAGGTGGPGGLGGPGGPAIPYRSRRRGGFIRPLFIGVLVFLALTIAWHSITSFSIPWFPIVVVIAIAFVVSRSSRRHH